jgi:pantothenate kinase-related protein Tda10
MDISFLLLGRYDKSAQGARGDRADPSVWPRVCGPVDIVLFEGWMSGFTPLPEEQVGDRGKFPQWLLETELFKCRYLLSSWSCALRGLAHVGLRLAALG